MVKKTEGDAPPERRTSPTVHLNALRARIAQVIRIVFLVLAATLALGAILVALRSNVSETNAVVKFVLDLADTIDGPFSRQNGVFDFSGKNAVTKNAVVNWGLAAIVYLVVGRVLDRLVSPSAAPRK